MRSRPRSTCDNRDNRKESVPTRDIIALWWQRAATLLMRVSVTLFVPFSLAAQNEGARADASREWHMGVAGGLYRDGFDEGDDGDRTGKLLGVRLLRDLPNDATSGLIYGLAFDLGVTHDVASHAMADRIVSGYLWDILTAEVSGAWRLQTVSLRAGVRVGAASQYRTREAEVGNPIRLPAGTMASRRQFGPVAGAVVGLSRPARSRAQFNVEALAYGMNVESRNAAIAAVVLGLSWRP